MRRLSAFSDELRAATAASFGLTRDEQGEISSTVPESLDMALAAELHAMVRDMDRRLGALVADRLAEALAVLEGADEIGEQP